MKVMYGDILNEMLNIFHLSCSKTYKFSKSVSAYVFKCEGERENII